MTGWRPVRTAFYFALLGPLIGAVLLLLAFEEPASGSRALAPAAIGDLIISGYIIGLPPMLATGFLVAVRAQRGRSFFGLIAYAAILGAVFGGLSALLWVVLGPPSTVPSVDLIAALAIAGGAAGIGCVIIVGLLSLFRPRNPAR